MASRWFGSSTSPTSSTKDRCDMQGAVLYGARDVRFEDRAEPTIVDPTDAIISLPVTCICGSDLWPYRGIQATPGPVPMGHEYCGYVEEVGRGVTSLKRGQFVIGSFFASDNTCPHCRHGYQTSCERRTPVGGAQAPDCACRSPTAHSSRLATCPMPTTFPACSHCLT
jgi:threonine dehydrogenase-like Zn-dependent dehydrogenase